MAKKSGKIPARYRAVIEPILIHNEVIKCAFRESYKWEGLFRSWIVLTNLRLIVLNRMFPGVKLDEFHLRGMDVDLFLDNVGVYDSIELSVNGAQVYQVAVFRTRREEAQEFVREVTENIAKLEFGQPLGGNEPSKEDLEKCSTDRRHLKDLKKMGAITESEYKEEKIKPCEIVK